MPENTGYYKKFIVIDNRTGEEVVGRTFTLKLDSDPFALPALKAYVAAAKEAGGYDELVAGFAPLLAELEE